MTAIQEAPPEIAELPPPVTVCPGVTSFAPDTGPRSMATSVTYALEDGDRMLLVEPATRWRVAAWVRQIEQWRREQYVEIALTHEHFDHSQGVSEIARMANVPVSVGSRVGSWDAIPTPGHDKEHFCLCNGHLLVLGDALEYVGLAPKLDYFRSLRRIRELPFEVALPAHGEPIARVHLLNWIAWRLEEPSL